MQKLFVKVAKGNENYGTWIDAIPGIYGQGDTVEEAKSELQKGLNLYIKHNKELPEILKGKYEIIYQYDTQSFLKYYENIFSKPALEKITGINQKQLWHYSSGKRRPKQTTTFKIQQRIHQFADDLRQIQFV